MVANAACGCLPPQRCRYSNRVLVQCPFREPMPPAAVCHLSVAGTPTASWSSAQSGCQCRLQLSATLAPPVLQPRLGSLPFREPMPPATVCHLSAAGTTTASWSSAQSGCQCRLQLSATSALPALQPRPGTGTMPTSTPEASWRGEALPNRFQTGLFPILWLIFATATLPTSTPEASWRGEGDIYRPFGTGTLNRTTSGAGSSGKTVWNRCQTGLLPMLRPDFGTTSPARGLSVASWRGEAVIYRLFVHKKPLFHGR